MHPDCAAHCLQSLGNRRFLCWHGQTAAERVAVRMDSCFQRPSTAALWRCAEAHHTVAAGVAASCRLPAKFAVRVVVQAGDSYTAPRLTIYHAEMRSAAVEARTAGQIDCVALEFELVGIVAAELAAVETAAAESCFAEVAASFVVAMDSAALQN